MITLSDEDIKRVKNSFINAAVLSAEAGFVDIRIRPKDESREFIRNWVPGRKIEDYVASATIEAVKPKI